MKKILIGIVAFISVLIVTVILSRNFIIKKILEIKLTEINKGKVDIASVDFSPIDKKIIIKGIDITSRKDTLKNFVSIDKFEADYDIYFKDKKVLVSKAEFTDFEFMTNRSVDGSIGIPIRDEKGKSVEIPNLKEKKNRAVENLEELIAARTEVSQEVLQNILQSKYIATENLLNSRKEYWRKRLKALENTPDYKVIVETYNKIAKEKNPLKIIRMESSIKDAAHSFKKISKELLKDRENMKKEFKEIVIGENINNLLEESVNKIVGKGELIVLDLDSLVNFYLNEIYKENIDEFVARYRNLMKEVELRRDEDIDGESKWEVFIEELDLKTELYGLNVEGEINNISSKLSKNLDSINFLLKADSDKSHGEVKGILDIGRLKGNIKIDISKFDFSDLQGLEIMHKYLVSGQAGLQKDIILTRDDIYISGDLYVKKMQLNARQIIETLNIKSPFLKDMIIPLIKDITIGQINYKYNSVTGKLELKSNLSKEIMNILNSEQGKVRKKITETMLKEGHKNIEKYTEMLDRENKKILDNLNNDFNEQTKYLDKVQEILDKFNITGGDDFTNKIINKIFR